MSADNADYAAMKEKILEAARKQFRPEFLNRFDDISVFRMLERDDLNARTAGSGQAHLPPQDQEHHAGPEPGSPEPDHQKRLPIRSTALADAPRHRTAAGRPLAESLLRGDVKPGDKIEAVETDGTETLTFLHVKDKAAPKTKTPRKRTPRKPKAE